jgi:hypothetical protein
MSTKDNNKNYIVEIKVENLAEVSRLESSKNAYVVWMKRKIQWLKHWPNKK